MSKTIYVSPTNIASKLKSLKGKRILHVKRNGKRNSGGQFAITVKDAAK